MFAHFKSHTYVKLLLHSNQSNQYKKKSIDESNTENVDESLTK